MSFRYIGSKARVAGELAEFIGPAPRNGRFIDAFCGTGAVAEIAATLGWSIRLNDHLTSATTMAAARLLSKAQITFARLGGYVSAIEKLNGLPPIRGFIWREYSPASAKKIGLERRYFTEQNAGKIDAMRAQIKNWAKETKISVWEETLLVADLLGATNRVANIAGTYGCFLSKWTPQAGESIQVRARELKQSFTNVEISNVDVVDVKATTRDLVYLDPPYTKRQYASYYHILETVARGDEPVVTGVSGLREWKSLASDFCYKTRALDALSGLIQGIPAQRILLSYSNQGHVELDALRRNLRSTGKIKMHELASIGRYRPNVKASENGALVSEFLIELTRSSTAQSRPRTVAFECAATA